MFCAQVMEHRISSLSGSCEDQEGLLKGPGKGTGKTFRDLPSLVLFHLQKRIPEEFSVRSGQQQSYRLQGTTLQCVLATTVRFSFRSYYHPLQNSYTFKHRETKLSQCLHRPRNKTFHTQRSCLLRCLRETIQTKSRCQEKQNPVEFEHGHISVFPQEIAAQVQWGNFRSPVCPAASREATQRCGTEKGSQLCVSYQDWSGGTTGSYSLGIFWQRHPSIPSRSVFTGRQDKQ